MHKIDFSDWERIYVTHMHLTRPYAVVAGCTTYLEWAVSFTSSYTQTALKITRIEKEKNITASKRFLQTWRTALPMNLAFLESDFSTILFYFHRWSNIEDDDDLGLVINDESKLNFMLRLFFISMSILNLEKELKPCKQGTKTTKLKKLWFTLN
jgi:hypothetical protein